MQVEKLPIKSVDIYNENFDHFFIRKLNSMTDEQRNKLPKELSYKIFRNGFEGSAERLKFQEKMYILSVAFGHKVTIMVDDEKEGVNMREFSKAQKASIGKVKNGELLEDMRVHAGFVIADKELMAASLYMNHASCSNIYSLVKELIPNTNHKVNQKFLKAKKEINTILNFLINYEANKKLLAMNYNLTMPKWYALLYFSVGEKLALDFYDKDYKYAYSSDRRALHRAMVALSNEGFLVRRGEKKKYRYAITASGLNLLNRIFDNILFKI